MFKSKEDSDVLIEAFGPGIYKRSIGEKAVFSEKGRELDKKSGSGVQKDQLKVKIP